VSDTVSAAEWANATEVNPFILSNSPVLPSDGDCGR